MKKRVYALYRVSTKGQVDKDDIPMQKKACHDFAADKENWEICKEFYEKGISGFKVSAEKRDAIQDLKLAAENKEFDVLLVFMFDRLGRIQNETPFVLEWFVKSGIEVWSTKEGQQVFENDSDYLMNYIRFWQAGGESKKTSMRVKTRLGQLVEEGFYTGGVRPFGYRYVPSGKKNKKGKELVALKIDEEEAQVVQFIFDKYRLDGYGFFRISELLNKKGTKTQKGAKFQPNNVMRVLKNKLYIGIYARGGKESPVQKDLIIIAESEFNEVQKLIKERQAVNRAKSSVPRMTSGRSLLSGNIYCGHCGAKMYAISYVDPYTTSDGTQKVYKGIKYICPNRGRNRGECNGKTQYSAKNIDPQVIGAVEEILSKIKGANREKLVKKQYMKIVEGKKRLYEELQRKYDKEKNIYDGLIKEVGLAMIGQSKFSADILNSTIENAKIALAEYETKIPLALQDLSDDKETLKGLDVYFSRFISWSNEFNQATPERKKMIIGKLIERIEISAGYKVRLVVNMNYEQFTG